MNESIEYRLNYASAVQIAEHLSLCDGDFVPPLSCRVEIESYATKIAGHATRFEAWAGGRMVGLVGAYCNDVREGIAYITSVSTLRDWTGKGIATRLMNQAVEHAGKCGMKRVMLEVARNNLLAIRRYEKSGFAVESTKDQSLIMSVDLDCTTTMKSNRDYNLEIKDAKDHKYAYGFDFDVMHPYMIRSFKPFFQNGNALELGSFKGDFTQRLLAHFSNITCVEASDAAIAQARQNLGNQVTFVNSPFEMASLPTRYDNIILTHVLEHLDDPIAVLKRINREWLSENGRLFLACPNANAPSRQIAVKMGLINHNAAVTIAEAEHGHRRTYTLDTLEHDAIMGGLNVIHRSGIFFKALANFQWDRLLQTDIVSPAYLDGCYKLGQHYPDLCASIFLVCERG